MLYHVKHIQNRAQIEQCEQFTVSHYMWESKKKPKTYGWAGYLDGEGIFVKMVCEEQNPKREYTHHREPVYQDSAMEIFLAFPGKDEISNECMYTNFEVNANGAMLANFGKGKNNRQSITDEQFRMSEVNAVQEDDRWYLEVLFPESYLNQICNFADVKNGALFYCNFYKISEAKEIQHFGSYSPIDSAVPNFHLPVCFAKAIIE